MRRATTPGRAGWDIGRLCPTHSICPAPTTLVTGATGFVGSAVARTALARGHQLRLLVRRGSDRRNVDGLAAELVEGDLRDPASLARAVAGCDFVMHVAADYRLWVPDPVAMMQANVDGTAALLRAARDAGVRRIVYCSSVAALGLIGDGTPGTETTPVHEEAIVGVYKTVEIPGRAGGQRRVADEAVPAVIVNPSTPVGPRDIKPTPTGKMVLDGAAGRMPAYVDTGLNVVHVDDVAEGHVLALERGVVGESYILGGTDMMLEAILAEIDDIMGRRQRRVRTAAGGAIPGGTRDGRGGAGVRYRADGDARDAGDGQEEDVLQFGQGQASAGLRAAAGAGGVGRRDRLVPGRRAAQIVTALAALAFVAWAYLLLLHGRFWQAGPMLAPARPGAAPDVDVVIPARDEAESIEAAVRSLLAQDYPGALHVIVVDDRSSDGTGELARALAGGRVRFSVIDGAARPPGWSGKLWAVEQGVQRTSAGLVLLADADIVHEPAHVSTLVAKAEQDGLDLVSEMVSLRTVSLAERALVPAFVFFFQLLYPFARVNAAQSRVAAAAGGTMLVRRAALERIGGIASLRGALIDDVTLAARIKQGGRIFLGHSELARSLRPYPDAADMWRMVARTAYVQLRFSPALLLGTVLGLALIWLVPPGVALFGHGAARWLAATAWAGSALSYVPTLQRFGQGPLWALGLPVDRLLLYGGHDRIGGGPSSRPGRGLEKSGVSGRGGLSSVETWSGKDRGDENFPVGSALIRPALRPHVHAYYAFARNADDIADSPDLAAEDKVARLDRMEAVLLGRETEGSPSAARLRESLAQTGVDQVHALELLIAFRQDATKRRYANWDELLNYCRYSAMPVGRYMLDLHGEDRSTWAASDALCASLQVLNHLQDGAKDLAALDRCYLPQDMLAEAGAQATDVALAAETPGLRQVFSQLLDQCDALNDQAEELPRRVRDRRLRLEVAVIVGLARRLARRLRAGDPVATRVKLQKSDVALSLVSSLRWAA